MLLFDCETNGFLDALDRIHCLVIKEPAAGHVLRFRGDAIRDGIRILHEATHKGVPIVGHNVIGFDVPALQKVQPGFKPDMRYVIDTMVLTCLIWPDTNPIDAGLVQKGRLPSHMRGWHTLEAWGYRLGVLKGEYRGDPSVPDEKVRYETRWVSWNQSMEDYCVQDVEVTYSLYMRCMKALQDKGFSTASVELEHDVKRIVSRQERHGIAFDVKRAEELASVLLRERLHLETRLQQQFGTFYTSEGTKTPTRSARYQCEELGHLPDSDRYRTMDFTEGAAYTKVRLNQFNPGSRDHVANRLQFVFGWEPSEFTQEGKPKVDEAVLEQLEYPGTEDLKRYFMVTKRLGQLAEGREAWLKHVTPKGLIHGRVSTNKAVTGRMAHSNPNLGQVPSCTSPFGKECRSLFMARPGMVLVGADADALELRDLAGYMARHDGGAYVKTILDGRKEDGTDMHSVNCRALGMDPEGHPFGDKMTGRAVAKTWFYAFIYGAGDEKLGTILTLKKGPAAVKAGRDSRARFMKNLPALGKLVERVKAAVKERGHLKGLDGRILSVRSQHSALNTLLQAAGAVQMKKALVLLDNDLQSRGLVPGVDYEFVANVHDEWQIECKPSLGEDIGKAATQAIRQAGEAFNFGCPLAGDYKIGRNWAETH